MQTLNWGIVATGFIAERFAEGLATCRSGCLRGVASRSEPAALVFARRFGAAESYGSLDPLLSSPQIDAIYVATPHPYHAATVRRAIAAGKHVLCEKPIAMSGSAARELYEAASAKGVVLMEGYMYRCHPQTQRLQELLQEGVIGRPLLVQASFGFRAPYDPESRLFSKALGGGAILDVGGYPLSFACLAARLAGGDSQALAEVASFQVEGALHPEAGVDTLALATLRFGNGLLAQLSVGTQATQPNAARIIGETGSLSLTQPWIISRDGGDWSFEWEQEASSPRKVGGSDPRGLYGIEADHFADLVSGRRPSAPGISAEESIQLNGLLERWRIALGVTYPEGAP